ncbi:MAG: ScaI family restriction endonuclease [Planctomycetes bacterium]|nr:ScaI family restriction endonuclease [Planctomycetota bacterium]
MTPSSSPYDGKPASRWQAITKKLIDSHPLGSTEIVSVTLGCWDSILTTDIGGKYRIGIAIFPKPQIMAFFLHELIPLELARIHPLVWRPEAQKTDKDIVHIPDASKSIEIKTSSHASKIFGNRSYAQKKAPAGKTTTRQVKSKSGFLLAINFDKFKPGSAPPKIRLIRFGWIDHSDWRGQAAQTGQQASLSSEAESHKLIVLFKTK